MDGTFILIGFEVSCIFLENDVISIFYGHGYIYLRTQVITLQLGFCAKLLKERRVLATDTNPVICVFSEDEEISTYLEDHPT